MGVAMGVAMGSASTANGAAAEPSCPLMGAFMRSTKYL
jgi:hypothetical protein